MEQKEILKKISSKYILKEITSFIYDINFPFKLFKHSNYFQKKLELNYIDYQQKFLENLGINFLDYIYLDYSQFSVTFDKDILKRNLNEKVKELKVGIDYTNKFALKYLKNYYLKYQQKRGEFIVEIFSPFFDLISNSDFFEHIITIQISVNEIKKFKLSDYYISFFEKMNKSNNKYSSLFFKFQEDSDIKYLSDFKINFKQIKRLTINEQKNISDNDKYSLHNESREYYIFMDLFSLEGIQNLIYLDIDLLQNKSIDPDVFIYLNDIKSLKELNLNKISFFHKTFVLNLPNLEKINFQNCGNITFAEDSCLKIKKFVLYKCNISKPKNLLRLPQVEECILQDEFHSTNQLFNEIIDFSSLKKLKILKAEKYDFIHLKDSLLENVSLYSNQKFYDLSNEVKIEKRMIEKLINITTLKKIDFILKDINNEIISQIDGENYSVKDLCVNWKNNNDCILHSLQYKFLRVNNLIIKTGNSKFIKPTILDIRENSTSNVHEININSKGEGNIKFYIESFENLFKVNLDLDNKIDNIENIIPFLNDKCNRIYKLLTHFNLTYYQEISLDILKNITNNIEKMPNLKELSLRLVTFDPKGNYKKLFKRILSLNLDIVNVGINILAHSKINKKNFIPNVATNNLKKLYINKNNKLYLSD